jgi:L-alanine-DL-glutamate epimerase-like enolase superfamily enzyme
VLGWRDALRSTERLTAITDVMLVESVALRGDIEGLAEFRRRSRHPVSEHAHGQRHAWQLLHLGAVDILNISPYVLGGLRPTIRAAAMAEAAGASVLLGTTQELSLGTAAVAHVGAVLPSLPYPSDNIGPRLYTSDVVKPEVQYEAGHLMVPEGPGLGPVADRELLTTMKSDGNWSFGLDLAGAVDRTLPA